MILTWRDLQKSPKIQNRENAALFLYGLLSALGFIFVLITLVQR